MTSTTNEIVTSFSVYSITNPDPVTDLSVTFAGDYTYYVYFTPGVSTGSDSPTVFVEYEVNF